MLSNSDVFLLVMLTICIVRTNAYQSDDPSKSIIEAEVNGGRIARKAEPLSNSSRLVKIQLSLDINGGEDIRNVAQEEKNKELVRTFYQRFFGDLDLTAAEEFISADEYIQHNPFLADGRDAFLEFMTEFFKNRMKSIKDIRRIASDGDTVYVHVKESTGDEPHQFQAVMDIFRVKDDKIVEHWDVIQDNPPTSENDHPFFN